MKKEIKEEIIETSEEKVVERKEKFKFVKNIIAKIKTANRKKIKNEALFKRGGYSLAITALVLAVLILFNWLVGVLSDRFHLEFDMSSEKINSISEENIEYIKNIEDKIDIIVCGNVDDYAEYMGYYAQQYHNATGEADYFAQTPKLIQKYADYNDNITIKYIDPQTSEFTTISQNYANLNLSYGDIIVTCTKSGDKRVKQLTFDDVYYKTDESGYAASGYGSYTISANTIETALSSAIAYVSSTDSKKVALLTGHTNREYASSYVDLLDANNYDVEAISDSIITEIPKEYDAVIIMAPTLDFIGSEIDAISEFLDNDGKLDKGLLYFADATCPSLPNLYEFLQQWGISIGEGIVFETDERNHMTDDPLTMGVYPSASESELLKNMNYCITGDNVPMTVCDTADTSIKADSIIETNPTTVVAPAGVEATWSDYTEADMKSYSGIIVSEKSAYDDENIERSSYVIAFGTSEYIASEWASYSQLSNQDITLNCTDLAANVESTGMRFTSKTITSESFADAVSQSGTLIVRIIFVILLPLAIIAYGIFVYIRRKNAQ